MSYLSQLFSNHRTAQNVNRVRPRLEALEDRLVMNGTLELPDGPPLENFPGIPPFANDVPVLQSNPGAAAGVFLDFGGSYLPVMNFSTQGTLVYHNVLTPAFDLDGDPTTTTAEHDVIEEIWSRVSEDFSPFNLNVTTVRNTSKPTMHVAIGGSGEWLLNPVIGTGQQPQGGVGLVNSFTNGSTPTVFVFSHRIAALLANPPQITPEGEEPEPGPCDAHPIFTPDIVNCDPQFFHDVAAAVANTSSHEAGHGFGLEHQSLVVTHSDGSQFELYEYHPGEDGWAPIMGNGPDSYRSTWHNGHIAPYVTQNDMAILAGPINAFGYRADDHSNYTDQATVIDPESGPVIISGIIGDMHDRDWFTFTTDGGWLDLDVNVLEFGANLDVQFSLYKVGSDYGEGSHHGLTFLENVNPDDSLSADLVRFLDAGSYLIKVQGAGQYGDVGQYTLEAGFLTALPAPTDPPIVVIDSPWNPTGGTMDWPWPGGLPTLPGNQSPTSQPSRTPRNGPMMDTLPPALPMEDIDRNDTPRTDTPRSETPEPMESPDILIHEEALVALGKVRM